jgi:3alpha(or 20beta)-hydroxysteroid dehydrogenase
VPKLEDRVALITGGAGGIGAATAHLLAAEGARVVVADVRRERAAEIAEEIGTAATAVDLDVTSPESWRAAMAETESALGGLDVLVNNAGYFTVGPIETMDLAELQRCIAVNQIGCVLGIQAAIPLLRRSMAAAIVNMSSGSGMAGFANQTAYASTKWAIRGITRCAAAELAVDRVRVNSVHPGPVNTPMINRGVEGVDQNALHAEIPIPRWADSVEVARLVLFLGCDDSSYCTGAEFVIDGGLLIGPRL